MGACTGLVDTWKYLRESRRAMQSSGCTMDYDEGKLQEAVLALLGAFEFQNGRVWKRYDFGVMEALHTQGWITDPHGRNESVYLSWPLE
jgi:Domain of unknown function (DUF6429)